jgi:hypothetical protein
MIDYAMNEVRELLKPFEAGPVEWARLPMNKTGSAYGMAISAPLIDSACSPEVLADLISGIVGRLMYAIQEESLAGLQITFGKSDGTHVKRCYRIMIPADRIAEVLRIEELPDSYDSNPTVIRGFWFKDKPV